MAVISTTVDVLAGQSSNGDIVVTPGELVVFNGGTIADTVVADAGETIISAGGSATGTYLQDDGIQGVFGTAIGTLVASSGAEVVGSGGVTSGATVFKGGIEAVGFRGTGSAFGMICRCFSSRWCKGRDHQARRGVGRLQSSAEGSAT